VRGETFALICFSQRSRNCATVTLDGSTYSPLSISVINLAHSVCAWRFVPLKLCHSAAAGAIGDAGKARMVEQYIPFEKQ
jgi:hypothetical protein